jgi:hypothetical protein
MEIEFTEFIDAFAFYNHENFLYIYLALIKNKNRLKKSVVWREIVFTDRFFHIIRLADYPQQ